MKTLTTLFLTAVSSVMLAQTIPNASFETWSVGNPAGWYTLNLYETGSVTQSSNAYSGSSAASLNSVLVGSTYVGGFLQSNTLTDGFFSYPGNPAALNGWYILNSVGGDMFEVEVLTKNSADNGAALKNISTSTSVYKQFSACINYSSGTADSAEIVLDLTNTGGATHAGSYVIVDDLSFGSCTPTGIEDINNTVALEPSYPNPASTICNIIYSIPSSSTVHVALYDLSGRMVMNILDNTNQTPGRYKIPVNVHTLANGVYVYTITVDGVPYTQKLVVAK
jgi:hypothetical protein